MDSEGVCGTEQSAKSDFHVLYASFFPPMVSLIFLQGLAVSLANLYGVFFYLLLTAYFSEPGMIALIGT